MVSASKDFLCKCRCFRYGEARSEVELQVIRGVRKENENLVPDVVKNIKETISLPCDFKAGVNIQYSTCRMSKYAI